MFDAKKEKDRIIKFIRDYYQKYNLKGAVIGISGGKDSAVVAGLFVEALGKENVIGLTLPCHSKDQDREDAKLVSDYFGFKLINIDLTETFDNISKQFVDLKETDDPEAFVNSDINLKPRLRMATLYYAAAYYSYVNNGTYLVAGTSNQSEIYIGYYTKGGDNVCDISVLGDLIVKEVIQVGEEIQVEEVKGVPPKILYKTPEDGLSGKTDEEKIGIPYHIIDAHLRGQEIDEEEKQKILRKHNANLHKLSIPTYKRCD